MENTVGLVDSNSESDISDSWAVIDDDSSLEWNELSMGLNPPQHDFVKNRILGLGLLRPSSNSSKSELSDDDDSIEVVAEDHADNLSDEGAEVDRGEEWTGTDQLDSKVNVGTGTCRPPPDLHHYTTQLKKIEHKWRESNTVLIAIFIMGILGGLCLGYLWASHSYKSEDSSSNSIQPTRALLTKLEDEISFLRRQLHSAQSSLKSAISKNIPKLYHLTKEDVHTKTKANPFKVDYQAMCSITDVKGKNPVLQDFSKEYCLASDRPQANEHGWTNSANNMSINILHTSSSRNITPVKNHLEVITRLNSNTPNEYTQQFPHDANQVDQIFQESGETASFEALDGGQHVNAIEVVPSSNVIAGKTSEITSGDEKIVTDSRGRSDPRPYTKLRTIVEKIYTILSVIDNENQTDFPSQLELLSILPHNIVSLDLVKGCFNTNVCDKITSSTMQMHDITQKLFADVDSSINSFVQHIAFKIKEIESFNRKQICNLKTIVKSHADIALLDLDHKPIFTNCVQEEKQNDHNDLIKNEYKNELNPLTGSQDIFTVSDSSTFDQEEPSDNIWMVKGKDYIYHELEHRNENIQQSDKDHLKFEFGDAKEGKDRGGRRGHKKRSVQPDGGTYSDMEIKSKIVNADKNYKSGAKQPEVHVTKKREKSGMKKKLNNKVNYYNNVSPGKDQKDNKKSSKWVVNTNKTSSNMSGEWAIKMAHGRAEQRRRDHQSDWIFERAKSRLSNRRKSIKESYWHNDRYHATISDVCNKTVPLKDQTSKRWKEVKQHIKKNLWKPLIDSAKSVKKAFNKYNNKIRYHSRQE